MKTNKIWFICIIIGTIFGLALSSANYYLNNLCTKNSSLCSTSQLIERITYFPTVYIFLSSAISFVNQNLLITILFFLIPILQYMMISSIIGLIMMRIKRE